MHALIHMLLEFLSVNLSMADTPPYNPNRLLQLINQSWVCPSLPHQASTSAIYMPVIWIHCQIWPPDASGPALLIHSRLYLWARCLMPVIWKQSYPISWPSLGYKPLHIHNLTAGHSIVVSLYLRVHHNHNEPIQSGFRGWTLDMALEVRVIVFRQTWKSRTDPSCWSGIRNVESIHGHGPGFTH